MFCCYCLSLFHAHAKRTTYSNAISEDSQPAEQKRYLPNSERKRRESEEVKMPLSSNNRGIESRSPPVPPACPLPIIISMDRAEATNSITLALLTATVVDQILS
jgi:hypothetical protein